MKPITQKFPMFSKDDASYLPTVTHFYEHRAETEARDLPGLYRRIPGLKNLAWDEPGKGLKLLQRCKEPVNRYIAKSKIDPRQPVFPFFLRTALYFVV